MTTESKKETTHMNTSSIMDILKLIQLILALIGGFFIIIKYLTWKKRKFLYLTNVQILNRSIWDSLKKRIKITERGASDHAFRPLLLIPDKMRQYLNVKNGGKVILEGKTISGDKVKVTAEVYWIPKDLRDKSQPESADEEHIKWDNIRHPLMSLVLRRYFGMERPILRCDSGTGSQQVRSGWIEIHHSKKHLDPLHKDWENNVDFMKWEASEKISWRYFNPNKNRYEDQPEENNFIEYCGLSILVKKQNMLDFNKS